MIREDDVAALLRAATDDVDVPNAPAEALVGAGRRRRLRRRVVTTTAGAALVAAIAVGAPLAGHDVGEPAPSGQPTTRRIADCVERVPEAVLPTWAREGFSDPEPRAAYVLSRNGELAAILFAQPLSSPPAADHTNKILWVARPSSASPSGGGSGPGPLRIEARLDDGSRTVIRSVAGGPGPSTIDLPRPGCWHLTLRWGGRTDTLDLAYLPA